MTTTVLGTEIAAIKAKFLEVLLVMTMRDRTVPEADNWRAGDQHRRGVTFRSKQTINEITHSFTRKKQRNTNRAPVSMNPQGISPVNLSLQKVMDVPVPEIKVCCTQQPRGLSAVSLLDLSAETLPCFEFLMFD